MAISYVHTEILPYLESALKAWCRCPGSIEVQFDELFVQVFKKLFHDNPGLHLQRSIVIIDAIDECNIDQDQKILLALIGKESASQRIPLRFIICSRPDPVGDTFRDGSGASKGVHRFVRR